MPSPRQGLPGCQGLRPAHAPFSRLLRVETSLLSPDPLGPGAQTGKGPWREGLGRQAGPLGRHGFPCPWDSIVSSLNAVQDRKPAWSHQGSRGQSRTRGGARSPISAQVGFALPCVGGRWVLNGVRIFSSFSPDLDHLGWSSREVSGGLQGGAVTLGRGRPPHPEPSALRRGFVRILGSTWWEASQPTHPREWESLGPTSHLGPRSQSHSPGLTPPGFPDSNSHPSARELRTMWF